MKEKPETAVEHFRPIFAERQLPFQPGADGIGLTVRAAAPECDLLMQFHPSGGEATRVTVHCAERRAYAEQPVLEARPAGRRRLSERPMTALQGGYRQLFESYGFRMGRAGISTGTTLSGHMQNANADVEAAQSVDGKVGSARTIVRAAMRRFELNAPIKTTLTVCVKGSFGN
ncbi:MAG: hypothetical protein OHK0021_13790 [Bryobacter sp.]